MNIYMNIYIDLYGQAYNGATLKIQFLFFIEL